MLKIKNNWQRLTEYWKAKKTDLNQGQAKMVSKKISLRRTEETNKFKKAEASHLKREVEAGIKRAVMNGLKSQTRRQSRSQNNLQVGDNPT